ncbi:helix-turn-helix domain-containing protein [Tropicimonas aquimaris]|uniref:Helix-turn-helix domain-containing protein n=1 Tax=Tropicimonas aquimaris TaxID=914152 RepID=A0ABW3IV89_9RHOB
MSYNIPLIRVAAIAPIHRWLVDRQLDARPFLERSGLGWVSLADLLLPIPVSGAVRLLVDIARAEGPDAPYRMARERGGFEIGLIGAAALQGPTVRDGFRRLSRQMPLHCTHEVFSVQTVGANITINDGWTLSLGDDEVLHYVQQYVAALVDSICSVATGRAPSVTRVGMVPHPQLGVSHLRPWLGDRVVGRADRLLDILVDSDVADLAMPEHIREKADSRFVGKVAPLNVGNSLSGDVATLVASMMSHQKPTVDALAATAGMSARTFRRRLSEEGTCFSDILERTRALIALNSLQTPNPPLLRDLASELGYANQETLTRAMQRWAGHTPTAIKAMQK